jgi:hypothetical protein
VGNRGNLIVVTMTTVAILPDLFYALGSLHSLPVVLSSLLRPPPSRVVSVSVGVGGVGSIGDNSGGRASVLVLFCMLCTLSRVALPHFESCTVALYKSDCIESNAPKHACMRVRVCVCVCVCMCL